MDQMPGNRVFRGSSFDAKSTFRVPRHSCARTFSGAPLAPPQMRWISPHALRAAPCDAAVVGAAPQRLRICALPCSVDADVPGAPAPFLDWGVRRTRPANTSSVHAGNGTRAARHCKICAPECRARPRTVSEQRELLPRPSLDTTRPCEGSVPVGCICKVGRETPPGRAILIVLGRGAIPRSDDTRHGRRPAARALPSSSSRTAPPIPRLDDTRRDPVFRRHTAAQASVPQPVRSRSHPRARARHPDPAIPCFGRHTVAWVSVLQPARFHPRARARHPDPALGHTVRSRVWDDTRRHGRRSCSQDAPTLELAHGTPIPRLDTIRRCECRSRSPRAPASPPPSTQAHARHPDPAFGRHTHTAARASVPVPQPALPPNLHDPGGQLLSLRVDECTLTEHPRRPCPGSIFCVRM
ncbi:hypothetical protein B0H14DRAFT_3858002, partial [Mycena olivaceomarginata]